MIRNTLLLLGALISLNSFAANFYDEEKAALQLVRDGTLDEADQMHTQVNKSATKYEKITDETGVEIGHAVEVTVEGYTYLEGETKTVIRFEYTGNSISKIVRK